MSQGKENAVAVSCSDEKHNNKIITEVKNGVLNIYVEKGAWNGWNWKGVTVKAYITVQQLEKLDASGASAVKIVEGLKVDFLKIDLSGASVLKGRVEATSLKLDASGASSISLTGKSNTASIDLSGASVLKAYELEIENCKVEASGASSIGIHVSKQLDVEASGASSIRYIGEPTIKQISVTGSSSVKPKG
ncbi:MAG: head GIN domain-containing protein [Chitinophagaceae bacterium]